MAIDYKNSFLRSSSKVEIPRELSDHVLAIRLNDIEIVAVFGVTPKLGNSIISHFSSNLFHGFNQTILGGDFSLEQDHPTQNLASHWKLLQIPNG